MRIAGRLELQLDLEKSAFKFSDCDRSRSDGNNLPSHNIDADELPPAASESGLSIGRPSLQRGAVINRLIPLHDD